MRIDRMQDKIAALICQLAEQGKDISVGLVRSKLTERAPLPFITRTINQYKANPQQFLESHAHLKNQYHGKINQDVLS